MRNDANGVAPRRPRFVFGPSVQTELGPDQPDFGRRDQPARHHPDGMQFAVERPVPEGEKFIEDRKFRLQVEFLPDEGLEHAWMVGKVLENLGRRQPVVLKLGLQSSHGRRSNAVAHAKSSSPKCQRMANGKCAPATSRPRKNRAKTMKIKSPQLFPVRSSLFA